MKKLSIVLTIMLITVFCMGCSQTDASLKGLTDGTYTVEGTTFDDKGYKPVVTIVVKSGAVSAVACDDKNKDGSSKKALSESGQYKMKEQGKSLGEWHEEIAKFQDYVGKKGVKNISINDAGKSDTISGCTIAISQYVKLFEEALAKAKA